MRTLLAVVMLICIIGCASTSPQTRALLAEAALSTEVVCESDQCKECWERAQLWLANHSQLKVQIATDVMLQTYNPAGSGVVYAFSVTKEPLGAGRYKIVMDLACGNMFGCSPKPEDVTRAFYHYVRTGKDLLVGMGYEGSIR